MSIAFRMPVSLLISAVHFLRTQGSSLSSERASLSSESNIEMSSSVLDLSKAEQTESIPFTELSASIKLAAAI